MEDEKFAITLRVAGDAFPLTIRRSEEIYYRQASQMIDNLLNNIRSRYGDRIAYRQMKMVALNLALNLVKKEDVQSTDPIFESLEFLDKEVVELLKL